MRDNRVAIGLVIGLENHDPLFDPHAAFQTMKTHPFFRRVLEGGKMIRYGAKTVPAGGWYAIPRTYMDGGLIVGDSAGFFNAQRVEGISPAIQGGMAGAASV